MEVEHWRKAKVPASNRIRGFSFSGGLAGGYEEERLQIVVAAAGCTRWEGFASLHLPARHPCQALDGLTYRAMSYQSSMRQKARHNALYEVCWWWGASIPKIGWIFLKGHCVEAAPSPSLSNAHIHNDGSLCNSPGLFVLRQSLWPLRWIQAIMTQKPSLASRLATHPDSRSTPQVTG